MCEVRVHQLQTRLLLQPTQYISHHCYGQHVIQVWFELNDGNTCLWQYSIFTPSNTSVFKK